MAHLAGAFDGTGAASGRVSGDGLAVVVFQSRDKRDVLNPSHNAREPPSVGRRQGITSGAPNAWRDSRNYPSKATAPAPAGNTAGPP